MSLRFVASFVLSFVESASVQGLASDKVCDKAHDKDWGELLKLVPFVVNTDARCAPTLGCGVRHFFGSLCELQRLTQDG